MLSVLWLPITAHFFFLPPKSVKFGMSWQKNIQPFWNGFESLWLFKVKESIPVTILGGRHSATRMTHTDLLWLVNPFLKPPMVLAVGKQS